MDFATFLCFFKRIFLNKLFFIWTLFSFKNSTVIASQLPCRSVARLPERCHVGYCYFGSTHSKRKPHCIERKIFKNETIKHRYINDRIHREGGGPVSSKQGGPGGGNYSVVKVIGMWPGKT